MATATATVNIDNYPSGINNIQRQIKVSGTIAISASPATYLTGGLPLSFVSEQIKAQGADLNPVDVFIESTNGSAYNYLWNAANQTIQIMAFPAATTAGGPLQEEFPDTTAIPASVSGDTIRFEAYFNRSWS